MQNIYEQNIKNFKKTESELLVFPLPQVPLRLSCITDLDPGLESGSNDCLTENTGIEERLNESGMWETIG